MKELKKAANRYNDLIAMVCGRAFVKYGRLDYTAFSNEIGISVSTLRRRLDDPETITLGELHKIASVLKLEKDEIKEKLPV